MPDAIFEHHRLARIYDHVDDDRSDLAAYLSLVQEHGARSVLDIGCGTGTFACLLAARGIAMTAVDPALASLDVARGKPHGNAVRWLHGDATSLPPLTVDMVTMTGNVAQVLGDGGVITSDSTLRFRTRGEIEETLAAAAFDTAEVRDAPDRPGLEFVFIAAAGGAPRDRSGKDRRRRS